MAEKNNIKKNEQQNNNRQGEKRVYGSRTFEHSSYVGESGECFRRTYKTGINSSIESGDTYPIDITLMTGNSNEEGGEK